VGDFVYLKASPTKGMQRFRIKGKLAPHYIGPYEIIEACGPMAYKLKLPPKMSAIHNVFHVSQLKKCVLLGPCFVAEGPAGRNTFGKACLYVIPKLPLMKLRYYGVSEDEGSNRLKGRMTF
jgi:hypothetical protein